MWQTCLELIVRDKGEVNKGDIVVGTCYKPLDQEKEENEAFLK